MIGAGKKKILIIDDDKEFCGLMTYYFKPLGYEVSQASNAEDAITAFHSLRPKVVLLDFNMPLLTGDKFLPLLQDADPTVKVIVVSGELEMDVEQNFRGMGYFAFFQKGSLSLEKLKEKVDEALSY